MKTSSLWQSKLGFILASAGAAVGLGNIQRFPYIVANYGGGAFLFVYLLCVLLIGIPLILSEFSLGRLFKKNPALIFEESLPQNKFFKFISLLPILVPFFIFSYYLTMSAWTFSYTCSSVLKGGHSINDITSNGAVSLASTLGLLVLISLVLLKGVNKGIESLSKILMPLLFVFMVALSINSLMLDNASEGLKFFLTPDFSKIDAKLFIFASGQAFFSLCVGEGVLMTYGSYTSKKDNLFSSTLSIAFFDTIVAFMSGLIIFPAIFSLGLPIEQGPTMIFDMMSKIFMSLPYGHLFLVCFFLVLCFAAITTCLALMEVVVNYLSETFLWNRKQSILIFCAASLFLSLPISLSKGAVSFLSEMKLESFNITGLYEIMDFVWGTLGMIICGLLVAYIVGWKLAKITQKEVYQGSNLSPFVIKTWSYLVRYLCPVVILLILYFNFSS